MYTSNKLLSLFSGVVTSLFIIFSLVLSLLPALALASAGISITPFESIKANIAAGETITHRINIGLGDQDQAMDMVVEVMGFSNSLDGTVKATEVALDNNPFSARSFVSIDNPSFHLEPGQQQDIMATIQIPQDIGSGGRYAVINIRQGQPAGSGPMGSISSFNIPVLLTIKGTDLIHTGKIIEPLSSELINGEQFDIFTTFQNTGNHHFKVKGEVVIEDVKGEVLDTIHMNTIPYSIIPSASVLLKSTFIPKVELATGVYSIKSTVMLEDGTPLAEARGCLQVENPYITPPLPSQVSQSLSPSSSSVLQTEDGKIYVSFPQGAVISNVTVSLQSYPLEKLPTPPPYFKITTNCFRIDGITGLLAKEATITVKYDAADLEKAEGDASKLTLAQWSEGTSQWLLLKTTVDKEAMTLTTTTDQLGIFAIMVGKPPSQLNYALFGTIVAIIVIVLVATLLIKNRKSNN